MEATDLADLVPGLMKLHPHHAWAIASGHVSGQDLVVRLHLDLQPDRVATVRVLDGLEVFAWSFAGHESTEFAYEDEDRPEVLESVLNAATEAISGPTRIIVERRNSTVVKSTIILDPDGPSPRSATTTYPIRGLRAKLRGQGSSTEVLDFPRAEGT